jgi:hypothetical protein
VREKGILNIGSETKRQTELFTQQIYSYEQNAANRIRITATDLTRVKMRGKY